VIRRNDMTESRTCAVVIVNYRTPGLLEDCLHSLKNEIRSGTTVYVVENASGDDSLERIRKCVQDHRYDWCEVIDAGRNAGYAAGNNLAIERALKAKPDYVWLLNPDTVVRPGALSTLIEFLEARPDVGIAGSRLEFPDATPQNSAFRFPSMLGDFEDTFRFGPITKLLARYRVPMDVRDANHPCDWVAGASMLIRREVFDAIGMLDADYFLYFEETDFCWRSRQAGWRCWYVPESRVVHLVGQSTGVTNNVARKRRPTYWFDSRWRYFQRNRGSTYAIFASLAFAFGFACWRIRRRIQRKPDNDPPGLLADFVRHAFRKMT
jgi:N-acetylglucosaminyl-diphospho-decaprenol L-rhamnosyltransferase